MFRRSAERTFTHRVFVQTPVDKGHEQESLLVTYRVLDPERVEEFDHSTAKGQNDFLQAAIVNIDEILGAGDEPVQFNAKAFNAFLREEPHTRIPLIKGYFDAVNKGSGRKGN